MKNKSTFLLCFAALFLFACSNTGGNTPDNGNSSDSSGGSGGDNSSDSGGGGDPSGGNEIGQYAVLPTNANRQKVREMYDSWIGTYYTTFEDDVAKGSFNPDFAPDEARGTARIKSRYGTCSASGECTASEAIGYGMILTSLMEDWERFNKLLAYSKVFRINGTALMKWDISDFRSGSGGSATDADIDILASLFIAYERTKNQNYLNDALDIGRSIYEFEVDGNTKLVLPAMKNERMGNGTLYNISYISLAALKMLANYDNERDWNAVLDANISYMERVQNAGDGLWPDWSNASGTPVNPDNGSNSTLTASDGSGTVPSYSAYYKETPRIPWRIAWYYHWFGDERAKAMLDKGMAFLRSKGVSSSQDLKDFYSYTGGKQSNTNAGVIRWASLCALGMGSSDNVQWLDSCNDRIFNTNFTTTISDYYRNSLQIIYSMLFNGEF
ncbi:MAG: hypothetical protein LBQ76_07920 [Candidatus Fibromonas sp.]|jgi:endo-1,4-beta-D-glucanase Y|nr:hypothetical protein [Candidatus Fibromonas sp.]